MAIDNFTENQESNSGGNTRMNFIDDILRKTERAQCVLELVADAMQESELLPVIGVVLDQIKDIDRAIQAWNNAETINV